MQMLRDDHALIADYLKSETEAQRLANAAAARELEGMKLAVRTDAPAQPRLAQAEREPKRASWPRWTRNQRRRSLSRCASLPRSRRASRCNCCN